ncbi:hypothetical protein glysoja_007867 [Glycine soja]|nr:hypothetical protein glysoja_007867 [Glycine soja]
MKARLNKVDCWFIYVIGVIRLAKKRCAPLMLRLAWHSAGTFVTWCKLQFYTIKKMKSTSSTGSNEIKSVIIKPPLILQFIAAFSNDKNIIPVPAFYHTQWAPQYLEFVHLRYNGAIYKIQVRRHKERVYLADGLENFRKQLGIYESTTIQFFACDHHSPFDIHFIPTLERQTCGRQRHSSRKHMWTI